MQPEYVAKKSILPAFRWIILFFLIVPLIMIIYDIIQAVVCIHKLEN